MQVSGEKIAVEMETLMAAFCALSRLGEALGGCGVEFLEIAAKIENEVEDHYRQLDAEGPREG